MPVVLVKYTTNMKNWKKIAEGSDLNIPESDLERIRPSLDTLESLFRPLTKGIPDDVEPAVTFRVFPEGGE
jgi:hypothetical protein